MKQTLLRCLATSGAFVLLAGCANAAPPSAKSDPDPKIDACGGCATGLTCDTQNAQCIRIDEGCSAEQVVGKPKPNMMILLDRSGSMRQCRDSNECTTPGEQRWERARTALNSVLNTYAGSIRFGLSLFPFCGQDCSGAQITPEVSPSEDGAIQVKSWLNSRTRDEDGDPGFTCNNPTNTGQGLEAMSRVDTLKDTSRENFVLLVTDGKETKLDDNPDCRVPGGQAAGDLLRLTPSIRTYVIGFNDKVTGEHEEDNTQEFKLDLQSYANGGGTDRPYYADDTNELTSSLGEIASDVEPCRYPFDDESDINFDSKIRVLRDNDTSTIAEDPANGWQLDKEKKILTFAGTACEELRSGQLADFRVAFNCPSEVQ